MYRSICRLPSDEIERHGGDRKALVERLMTLTVDTMYASTEENKFIEVTYANGEKEVLYFKDFASGALIEGIVSRAKKFAVKRAIAQGRDGASRGRPGAGDPGRIQRTRRSTQYDESRRLGKGGGQEGRKNHPYPHDQRRAC